jgi:chromosome segregation protein
MEERKQRIESFYNETEKIEKVIEKIENEHSTIKQTLHDLTESVNQKQRQISGLEESLSEKTRQLSNNIREQEGLENQIKDHTTKTAKLQAEFDVLRQAEAALSGYSQGSKTIIDYSRKGQLPLGIEPLSQHMIVEEKFERAIAASLGELADLLIVPAEGANVIVEYLDQKENDRVALILLDQLKNRPQTHSPKNQEGFLGYANELIQVNQDLRYIIDALFSDILVMKDKQSAKKIQSKLVGDQKAVTLSGLVFHANGIVISGRNASGKRIGRTRLLNEMEQDLGRFRNDLEKMDGKKREILSKIADLKNEVDGLKSKFVGMEQDKANLKQDLQNAQITDRRLEEQFTWHNEQLASLQQQLTKTKESISEDEKKLQGHQDVIENLLEEEQKLLDNLNLVPIFDVQQELNQWQTHQIVAQNGLEAAQQRFTDHHGRLEVARQRLELLLSRMSSMQQQLLDIQKQEQVLRQDISQINDVIDAMKKSQIDPLTTNNAEIEQKANAFQKLADHHHEQVMLAERKYTQYQLELERSEDQINHLKDRIESDFGLVSYEYDQHTEGSNPLPFQNGWIENLPRVQEVPEAIEDDIKQLKGQIRRIGSINPEAQQEYIEVKERYDFLTEQIADLEKATKDLHAVIDELDSLMERDFVSTFKAVNNEFSTYFTRLFNGGEAKLVFSDDENPVEGGVDIEARLPGRRQQGLALLSGGERSLAAVALIFALLKVSPTPFCVLDEVDAMLDESNVGRFIDLLRDLSKNTQFVIITHNRNTVQAADVIYGVTMGRDSTSQMISLKLEEVDETYLE